MSTTAVLVVLAVALGPVLLSFAVEALRPRPAAPERLPWAPQVPIQYLTVHGRRLRYVETGRGPALVLLHTLRTQLDIFQKVIPPLAEHFTVYALDYPGHGYSDIPEADYEPELFVEAVSGFLDGLEIDRATLAGISIGGTISLLMAARRNPRVTRVVSINPYDYGRGAGIRRSSLVASVVFGLARIPVLGETVIRLRNRMLEQRIFEGGVAEPDAMPPALSDELYRAGARPGHYQAFLSLIRHAARWEDARSQYGRIQVPVLLVYGERDWSMAAEREATARAIPHARVETVPGGGHFLSLDRPEAVARLIGDFATAQDQKAMA